ncbi:MAG TPA: ERF family protein [Bradyrhizobium sp.]|nr:ERF family protein [Bradyrhizobium sp.]
MDRLLAMREREAGRIAQQCFNAAMSAAQAEMEPIRVDSKNDQTHSKYASYAALDRAVRLIYTRHGFALTFDTEDTPEELLAGVTATTIPMVRVVCDVCHRDGHTKRYRLPMPVDGKGAKGGDVMTRTHAMGSGITYGKRYLLGMIFNLAIDKDDDGNAAGGSGRSLPAKNARDVYQKLQAEIETFPTLKRLENWARDVEPLFLALPSTWREILTERYQERVAEFNEGRVIWDDGSESAATMSHRELMAASMEERPRTIVPAPKRKLELDRAERDGIPAFMDRR